MRTRFKRSTVAFLGTAALAASLAACGSSSSGGSPSSQKSTSTQSVASGGTATVALDENLAGFNINTLEGNEYVTQWIMNAVLPQVFITTPQYTESLNTDLVTSATQTSTSPQTIVYKINPKAQWTDGTPFTADDFIYNWQAESGNAKYKDTDGKPYDIAGANGYSQIKSVTGSAPANGSCAAGTAADRNKGLCPNGQTVTVVFGTPFPDWQSLFANLISAHLARKVGWNSGMLTGKNVVGLNSGFAGSWYYISSYTTNQTVVLTRNPKYWGAPGKLDKIVFRILSGDQAEPPALRNGEVNLVSPQHADSSFVQQTRSLPGVTNKVVPGLEFEHLDFNEANPYLAKLPIRQAIAYGTDRKTIIARTVGQIDPNITPLGNRMFVNTQPQYVDNGAAYATVNVAKAKQLLQQAGGTFGSDGYFHPNFGPLKGKPLSLRITTTTGNPIRSETQQLFQSQMKTIGIKISIVNQDANTYFGKSLPQGLYDIGEFAWVATPFVSSNQSIYCSWTKTTSCGQNYSHYANPQVDQLMTAGSSATSVATEDNEYNQADKVLWNDMATLPLYQSPQYYAWSSKVLNVLPNAASVGPTWNDQQWGYASAQ